LFTCLLVLTCFNFVRFAVLCFQKMFFYGIFLLSSFIFFLRLIPEVVFEVKEGFLGGCGRGVLRVMLFIFMRKTSL
jgi:hypothetical protein